MADIRIEEIDASTYQVTVVAQTTSTHIVTVEADFAQILSHGLIDNTALLKKSFEFLLQREPNTSILRGFI